MSHLTRIETELTDMDCLEQALKDLGYKVTKGGTINYHSDSQEVDIKAGNIGFKKQKSGKITMVGEWGRTENVENKVKQRYAFHKTIKEVTKSRKYSVQHTNNADGSIDINLNIL